MMDHESNRLVWEAIAWLLAGPVLLAAWQWVKGKLEKPRIQAAE